MGRQTSSFCSIRGPVSNSFLVFFPEFAAPKSAMNPISGYLSFSTLSPLSDATASTTSEGPLAATPSTRTVSVLGWVLLLLFAALSWILRAPAMLTRQDDARYLGLARALRMGTYRDIMWPGAPWHHMYPPGFPAILAIWTTLFGERFDGLIVLQIALSTAALAFTFLFLRRVVSRRVSILSAAMLALSPLFILRAGLVGSENALARCICVAVWASVSMPRGRAQTALLITMAVVAPLMRSVGVALTAALAMHWLLDRRYRDLSVLLVVAAIAIGGVTIWTFSDPNPLPGSSYAGDIALVGHHGERASSNVLARIGRRAVYNIAAYLTTSVPLLLSMPRFNATTVLDVVGSTLFSLALIIGLFRWGKSNRLASLTFVATAAILAMWPYQDTRFLIPVVPLLIPLVLIGLDGIVRYGFRPTASSVVLTACAGVLVVTALAADVKSLRKASGCKRGESMPGSPCLSPDQDSFFRASRFVRDSLPRDARILSAKSEPLYFYSGHITVPTALTLSLDSTTFWSELERDGAAYILLGALHSSEVRMLAPRLQAHCSALDVVATFPPHTYLLQIVAQPVQPGRACAAIADYRRTAAVL